jgi:hypothetical protein
MGAAYDLLRLGTIVHPGRVSMANKSLTATARKALLRRGRVILRRHQGSAGAEVDLLSLLSETERHQLEEIHAALERIERGIFGRCETCFEPLDPARITAMPWLRKCDECAEAGDSDEAVVPVSDSRES